MFAVDQGLGSVVEFYPLKPEVQGSNCNASFLRPRTYLSDQILP